VKVACCERYGQIGDFGEGQVALLKRLNLST
jgi:hypothetical protein